MPFDKPETSFVATIFSVAICPHTGVPCTIALDKVIASTVTGRLGKRRGLWAGGVWEGVRDVQGKVPRIVGCGWDKCGVIYLEFLEAGSHRPDQLHGIMLRQRRTHSWDVWSGHGLVPLIRRGVHHRLQILRGGNGGQTEVVVFRVGGEDRRGVCFPPPGVSWLIEFDPHRDWSAWVRREANEGTRRTTVEACNPKTTHLKVTANCVTSRLPINEAGKCLPRSYPHFSFLDGGTKAGRQCDRPIYEKESKEKGVTTRKYPWSQTRSHERGRGTRQ